MEETFKRILEEFRSNVSSDGLLSYKSNYSDHVKNEEVRQLNTTFGVILGAVVIILWTTTSLFLRKKKGMHPKGVLTIDDIPCHSYRFFGIKLPLFIEGIITPIQMRLYGIRACQNWVEKSGPIFRLGMLYKRLIFVTDVSLIQKILSSSDPRILNKPAFLYSLFFPKWMKDGLIASKFNIWEGHRKMLIKGFTYKTLANYLKLMGEHSIELVRNLKSLENSKGEIRGQRLFDFLQECSIAIIIEVLVGGNVSADKGDVTEFYHRFKKMKGLIVGKFLYPYNLIPPIWALNPKSRELEKLFQESEQIFLKYKLRFQKDIEKEKEEQGNKAEGKYPYKGLVVEMMRNGCSDYEIFGEVSSFLTAGQESSTSTISFFLQFMAEHPEIQRKVQEEVDALFDGKQDFLLTQEDVKSLKFMDRCVLETSRWMASIPLIFREIASPITIGNYFLEKGTTICIPIFALHRDPQHYPNPEEFNPDRFLPEEIAKRHPQSFLTFSHGPRNCIGMKVALTEMKVMLANILREFDVESEDKIENMKILFDITLTTERDFNLILKKRSKSLD